MVDVAGPQGSGEILAGGTPLERELAAGSRSVSAGRPRASQRVCGCSAMSASIAAVFGRKCGVLISCCCIMQDALPRIEGEGGILSPDSFSRALPV